MDDKERYRLDFAARLKGIREDRGMTRKCLSKLSGIPYSSCENYEQAIAATLGSGTCWKVLADAYGPSGIEGEYLACSECCEWLAGDDCTGDADGPNFCSGCGAKVLGTLHCPKCGKVMYDQGGGGYALCECGYEHGPNCGKAVKQ